MKTIGTDIFITQGDTLSFTVTRYNESGQMVNFEVTDTVVFSVKDNFCADPIIGPIEIKTFNSGRCVISVSKDVMNTIKPGNYSYDVRLIDGSGGEERVTTLIQLSKLIISDNMAKTY